MKRLIILLFASLVTVGLLVACSNPSAQPMNGNGNGNGDGNGDGNGETRTRTRCRPCPRTWI